MRKVRKAASTYVDSLDSVNKVFWSKANALADHTLSMHKVGSSELSIENQLFLPPLSN